MTESFRPFSPAAPNRNRARRPVRYKVVPGGKPAQRSKPRSAARRRHSPPELGLLALCAVSVVAVTGLVVFTILRDQAFLDRTAPAALQLNP
jgi:hypothetical protein